MQTPKAAWGVKFVQFTHCNAMGIVIFLSSHLDFAFENFWSEWKLFIPVFNRRKKYEICRSIDHVEAARQLGSKMYFAQCHGTHNFSDLIKELTKFTNKAECQLETPDAGWDLNLRSIYSVNVPTCPLSHIHFASIQLFDQ